MKSVPFKTSDHLKTRKDIVAYLNAALEDGEPAVGLNKSFLGEFKRIWLDFPLFQERL